MLRCLERCLIVLLGQMDYRRRRVCAEYRTSFSGMMKSVIGFVSLSIIRKEVQKSYPGRIVDVQLLVPKREGINFLYDVKVLTKSGKVLSVKVDAKSAKIVDVKG